MLPIRCLTNGSAIPGAQPVSYTHLAGLQKAQLALSNPQEGLKANKERWEGYLTKILRKDMKPEMCIRDSNSSAGMPMNKAFAERLKLLKEK